MEKPYPNHYDQLSPPHSVTAHDTEKVRQNSDASSHVTGLEDDIGISKRLTRLVDFAAQNAEYQGRDSETLHHCLDKLEYLLDPRLNLKREIVRCRPRNIHSKHVRKLTVSSSSSNDYISTNQISTARNPPVAQITALHKDILILRTELDQRHRESFQIYELFAQERQKLLQRISELESEINELHTDMLEDEAEREALEGTVRGLEGWISGWQVQHDLPSINKPKRASPGGGRGWWAKGKQENASDSNIEALLEGISAWMRGWKDAEEGFRSRERVRKMKRDVRQKERMIARNIR